MNTKIKNRGSTYSSVIKLIVKNEKTYQINQRYRRCNYKRDIHIRVFQTIL